ncbi:MAG TPA: hypothetical protein VN181_15740 [Thermoanaerobaculia bacterium]|nr:hypothetical protein [Thermoanaerobaculia bacterium]
MANRAWRSVLLTVAIAACRSAGPDVVVIRAPRPTLVAFAPKDADEDQLVDFRGEHAAIRDWCERAGIAFESVSARELRICNRTITPPGVAYVIAQRGRVPRSLPGAHSPDRVIAETCEYFRRDAKVRAACIAMDR